MHLLLHLSQVVAPHFREGRLRGHRGGLDAIDAAIKGSTAPTRGARRPAAAPSPP